MNESEISAQASVNLVYTAAVLNCDTAAGHAVPYVDHRGLSGATGWI